MFCIIQDIDGGLKEMDEIINDYCDVFFPLAYYGKVLGHLAQNK